VKYDQRTGVLTWCLSKKNSFGRNIHSFRSPYNQNRILLKKIYLLGSSLLNDQSKQELDKIAKILDSNKGIEFEIMGHAAALPVP
jgi:outer membrane protein OmpA-like peptidoglycan-associated protein